MQIGNRVVPLQPALGTWRTGGVFQAADWHAVPVGLSDAAAATLCIKCVRVASNPFVWRRSWGGSFSKLASSCKPRLSDLE